MLIGDRRSPWIRRPHAALRSSRTPLALGLALALSSCQSRQDVQEWTPDDHNNKTNQPAAPRQLKNLAKHAPPGKHDSVTAIAWEKQCAGCHGKKGRGDGPMSAMLGARDLADPAWQDQATDAAIAEVIRKGKGKMPAINLPDSTIAELVKLVRSFRSTAARPAPTQPAAAQGAHGRPSR